MEKTDSKNNEQDLPVEEIEVEVEVETDETEKDTKDEQTFTQSEMEDIISKRVAREKKVTEKAVAQAEKLAKMNEEEKREFEFEELQKELSEFRRKDAYHGLSKVAATMLTEQGIQSDDEILSIVVKDDADETKESVGAFVSLINRKVEEGVKRALAGKSPKVNHTDNKGVTKESIMAIEDATKRVKAINENRELFK